MAVKLRLKRMGRKNAAFYRLNAIESRSPRDGRVIEELGHNDPRNKDQIKQFVAKLDRCQYWLSVGAAAETFTDGLIEHPQYTRPREFRGMQVPDVLLSGNHAAIAKWRLEQRQLRTKQRRPDLWARYEQDEK